ncbi:N-6 DNA methylase [Geomonas nitrogeniifigens]|uniref:N-6 DNA methylase n=1 Tax=Geomonas diazotrophica TaxID=2843197 RepID=UPI001C2C827B|nr:N-6 DNA methylase [Geomonas nitrogeniifigens]QXE86375.1 N-6 DNA methylase [Geomonas nitrogeniifigens]
MTPYHQYLSKLELAAQNGKVNSEEHRLSSWHYEQVRRHLKSEFLKMTGAFFSGEDVSTLVANKVLPHVGPDTIIFDPACGAGDLLLACAKGLPTSRSFPETLRLWERRLAGIDINADFVRAAKARLMLLARERSQEDLDVEYPVDAVFDKIKVGDGLKSTDFYGCDDIIIVMNPPFNPMRSRPSCSWADGGITSAAEFLATYIENSSRGTRFIAVLPEVLRAGSRYQKWRNLVENNTKNLEKEVVGRFSTFANVDVFILKGEIDHNGTGLNFGWWPEEQTCEKVSDFFYVNVGSVVPHRDLEQGPLYPYLYTRDVEPWQVIVSPASYRRFSKRVFDPPFVVVRRTSAPKDSTRCVASVVDIDSKVAVENHFLVLTPKNGHISTCVNALSILKDQRTTHWLNERIKCRHLTVSSISNLPWWTEN